MDSSRGSDGGDVVQEPFTNLRYNVRRKKKKIQPNMRTNNQLTSTIKELECDGLHQRYTKRKTSIPQ